MGASGGFSEDGGDPMQLDDRKKRILSALVDCYVATGEPVGSKLLAGALGNRLSSATIRNEMAELSDLGLLEQPHTSAGRIPSQSGYRYYVDALMGSYPLTEAEQARINLVLRIDGGDMESLVAKAGNVLAAITGCVAVAAAPRANVRIRRVEVIAAGKHSLLVVLVAAPGLLRSRICRAGAEVDERMVEYFANLLQEKLAGLATDAVTEELMEEMRRALREYAEALRPVLDAVFDEIGVLGDSEIFLGGETNLFCFPEFHDGAALRMLRFLGQRDELEKLVCNVTNQVRVRIGTENGNDTMRDSSLIAAPYAVGGKAAGTVGIIGPTRMDYAKLVSHIAYFSTVLSKLVSDTFADE